MFAQLAVRGGTPAVLEYDMPRSEVLRRLAELGAEQVFISSLAPFAYAQAREVCRDLRSHFPGIRIVVALWDLRAEAERYRRRLTAAGADEVVATLEEAVRAIRLAPAREIDPAVVTGELMKAFRDDDLPRAETLLAEAERKLPVESLAVEVLQPALEELRDDAAAGRLPAEQEKRSGDLLRERLFALGDAAPEGQGYRALAVSASEEDEEIGLLILALLLRRAGWSVVHLGQRAPDEDFDDVIASVQPHAIVFSATLRLSANRLLALAEELHREHPELLFVLDGPGFRSSATARLDDSAIRVGDDARDALAAIERRMPPLPPPEAPEASEEEPGLAAAGPPAA
jgi:methanogenic corrinoid protein MtbC1